MIGGRARERERERRCWDCTYCSIVRLLHTLCHRTHKLVDKPDSLAVISLSLSFSFISLCSSFRYNKSIPNCCRRCSNVTLRQTSQLKANKSEYKIRRKDTERERGERREIRKEVLGLLNCNITSHFFLSSYTNLLSRLSCYRVSLARSLSHMLSFSLSIISFFSSFRYNKVKKICRIRCFDLTLKQT